MHERKLILILYLDHTLLTSTSCAKQDKGFTPDTFKQKFSDLAMLTKLRPFVRGFLKQERAMFEMHMYTLGT
jgi:RNA polymerase II C-terminal domain phosphatase-like 3/4